MHARRILAASAFSNYFAALRFGGVVARLALANHIALFSTRSIPLCVGMVFFCSASSVHDGEAAAAADHHDRHCHRHRHRHLLLVRRS